jgi:hypothetical protein
LSPRLVLLCFVLLLPVVGGTLSFASGCPSSEDVLATVSAVDPERGSRTQRFHAEPPVDLYGKAANKIGKPIASRDGKTVRGVLVIDRPVELIWKAINDEPHHALDGEYLPIRHSEVIAGTPRGVDRTLFQYFKKAGVGRWWVTRVEMNGELYSSSDGKIWEIHWQSVLDEIDPEQPPMNMVSDDLAPLKDSYGAWFIVPINGECTLVEYYNHTEPGGFVSFAQSLLAKSSVRDTFDAIVRLADEHLTQPHPDATFFHPDGTPLD